jgi:hypothetical protein
MRLINVLSNRGCQQLSTPVAGAKQQRTEDVDCEVRPDSYLFSRFTRAYEGLSTS